MDKSDIGQSIQAPGPIETAVRIGTHQFRQQFLYAFATQSEVVNHVRTQGVPSEALRIPEIVMKWTTIQPEVQRLLALEQGIADTSQVHDLPENSSEKLTLVAADPLFQRTFGTRNPS